MAVFEFTPADEAPDNQARFRGSQILASEYGDNDYGMDELMTNRMRVFRDDELPNAAPSQYIELVDEIQEDLKRIKTTAYCMDDWPVDEMLSQKRGAMLPIDLCERFIDDENGKDVIIHHLSGLALSVLFAHEPEVAVTPIESEIKKWDKYKDEDPICKLISQALIHAKDSGATLVAEQIEPTRDALNDYTTHLSVGRGDYDPHTIGNNYEPIFTINLSLVDELATQE
jgi:hypothetical protein